MPQAPVEVERATATARDQHAKRSRKRRKRPAFAFINFCHSLGFTWKILEDTLPLRLMSGLSLVNFPAAGSSPTVRPTAIARHPLCISFVSFQVISHM